MATVQTAVERERDYDGSTDEECENLTQPSTLASGKTEYVVLIGDIASRPIMLHE